MGIHTCMHAFIHTVYIWYIVISYPHKTHFCLVLSIMVFFPPASSCPENAGTMNPSDRNRPIVSQREWNHPTRNCSVGWAGNRTLIKIILNHPNEPTSTRVLKQGAPKTQWFNHYFLRWQCYPQFSSIAVAHFRWSPQEDFKVTPPDVDLESPLEAWTSFGLEMNKPCLPYLVTFNCWFSDYKWLDSSTSQLQNRNHKCN